LIYEQVETKLYINLYENIRKREKKSMSSINICITYEYLAKKRATEKRAKKATSCSKDLRENNYDE
jgi:hypothetical protein